MTYTDSDCCRMVIYDTILKESRICRELSELDLDGAGENKGKGRDKGR